MIKMYNNLKNILYKKNISIKQYSDFLGITEKSTRNKLQGVTDFTYTEFKKTCSVLLNEYNADFLFSIDE